MDISGQTQTPTRLSISKAAKLAGKSRQTLYDDRDNGKLSVGRNDKGQPYIEVAELERVYGKLDIKTVSTTDKSRQVHTPQKDSQDSALQVEVDTLREQISRIDQMHERERAVLEKQIDDLRSERDEWREQCKVTTRLLEDHREKDAQKAPEKPLGFWGRLMGRTA